MQHFKNIYNISSKFEDDEFQNLTNDLKQVFKIK